MPVSRSQDPEHDARAAPRILAAQAGRARGTSYRAALEEPGEAIGRLEEVERVLGGRRVEHHDVEVALLSRWYSFSIAMNSWEPAIARERW